MNRALRRCQANAAASARGFYATRNLSDSDASSCGGNTELPAAAPDLDISSSGVQDCIPLAGLEHQKAPASRGIDSPIYCADRDWSASAADGRIATNRANFNFVAGGLHRH